MKPFLVAFVALAVVLLTSSEEATPVVDSPLTPAERALTFDPKYLHLEGDQPQLVIDGEPLAVARVLILSPWDLMEVVQRISHTDQPLSRFGQGNGDELTQAWRLKVAAFVASAAVHPAPPQEDLFDPALVLWDPGTIQTKNEWGEWTIRLDRRTITQYDLPSLSPLEVQQAVEVLTARTYPIEFVLDHLEAFRAQLSVVPRLVAAAPKEHH